MSITPRLNRLFAPDGKCVEVALDHGGLNEPSLLTGIEDLGQALNKIVAGNPDAILLTVGQAHLLQDQAGKQKPSLVMRADLTSFASNPASTYLFFQLIDDPIGLALALDAVSIIAYMLWAPDLPDLYHQCVANVCKLKPLCERFGVPLTVEPLVMQPDKGNGGHRPDLDVGRNVALVRQAVELGADIVKANSLDHIQEYHKVIEAASGKPVLPLGGSRVSDEEILSRTWSLMQQGASGIVYGRNIYQHPHPQRIIRACNAIVHDGASVSNAMAILGEAFMREPHEVPSVAR